LDLKEVSLKTVINDMVGIFDMLIKRKDFEQNKDVLLRVAIKENLLETNIITDKLRLEQILSNLISNAIKFTDHGYIEIGCTKLLNSEVLEFYIKDTGIGIKEEYQQFIFERFRKIEDDKSHLHRGAGLGLAICSQLVNLLGGSIYLKSEIEKGSVFYFTIPLVKPDSPNKSFLITKPSNKLPDFKNITILVAEDDISNYTYIAKLLKNAGANVIHAMNGRQVLELLKNTHDIKLILMDIKMPELDGVETLHEIQKMKINIPIIAQTAYALAEEVVKLKNEGFDEYISKPIEREHLYFLMEKCLNSNEKKLNT
jgi:CheY-like chemotaxis protein